VLEQRKTQAIAIKYQSSNQLEEIQEPVPKKKVQRPTSALPPLSKKKIVPAVDSQSGQDSQIQVGDEKKKRKKRVLNRIPGQARAESAQTSQALPDPAQSE
jgi:hypothetical protein